MLPYVVELYADVVRPGQQGFQFKLMQDSVTMHNNKWPCTLVLPVPILLVFTLLVLLLAFTQLDSNMLNKVSQVAVSTYLLLCSSKKYGIIRCYIISGKNCRFLRAYHWDSYVLIHSSYIRCLVSFSGLALCYWITTLNNTQTCIILSNLTF